MVDVHCVISWIFDGNNLKKELYDYMLMHFDEEFSEDFNYENKLKIMINQLEYDDEYKYDFIDDFFTFWINTFFQETEFDGFEYNIKEYNNKYFVAISFVIK